MLAMLRHLVTHRQLTGLRPRVLTAMTWRNLSPGIAFGLAETLTLSSLSADRQGVAACLSTTAGR